MYRHSNRLCVVGLHPTHGIFKNKLAISSINFHIGKTDRLNSKIHGKKKKGAQWLENNSVLCEITCSDNSVWKVYSCVRGSLLEINENIIKNPQLLLEQVRKEVYKSLSNSFKD